MIRCSVFLADFSPIEHFNVPTVSVILVHNNSDIVTVFISIILLYTELHNICKNTRSTKYWNDIHEFQKFLSRRKNSKNCQFAIFEHFAKLQILWFGSVILKLIRHCFSFSGFTRAWDPPFLEENRGWTNLALARDFIFLATRRLWKIRNVSPDGGEPGINCACHEKPRTNLSLLKMFFFRAPPCAGRTSAIFHDHRAVTRHFDTFCSVVLSFRFVVNRENKCQLREIVQNLISYLKCWFEVCETLLVTRRIIC